MRRLKVLANLRFFTFCLSALGMLAIGLAQDLVVEQSQVDRITGSIVCDCGCANLIVRTCGCGRAAEMIAEVRQLLEAGNSEAQVFTLLEEKYGPTIHAAPKPEGFNLIAWLLPFVALAFGAIIVFRVVRSLKPTQPNRETTPEPSAVDEKYRRLIDKELTENY